MNEDMGLGAQLDALTVRIAELEAELEMVSSAKEAVWTELVKKNHNIAGFTSRQLEVFNYIMLHPNDPNKVIADALNIAPRTVKFHVSNILTKTKCASKSEMVLSLS